MQWCREQQRLQTSSWQIISSCLPFLFKRSLSRLPGKFIARLLVSTVVETGGVRRVFQSMEWAQPGQFLTGLVPARKMMLHTQILDLLS